MSEENVPVMETAVEGNAPDAVDSAPEVRTYTQEEVDAMRADAEQRVARAEKQRQKANTEAANRRHREKELTDRLNEFTGSEGADASEVIDRIAQIEAENRAWKLDDLTRQATDMAGVDPDLAMPWLKANGKLDDIDVSDRQMAFTAIDARVKEFAERYPTVVNKVEPVPQQSWGTPESVDKGSPPADIVAYLERVRAERPEDLIKEWDRLGGDDYVPQML